jgi:hypothetical protein
LTADCAERQGNRRLYSGLEAQASAGYSNQECHTRLLSCWPAHTSDLNLCRAVIQTRKIHPEGITFGLLGSH